MAHQQKQIEKEKKYIYHYILQLSTNEENDKMNTYGWKKKFCDIYANTIYLKAMNIKGNKMTLIKHVYND